MNHYNTPTKLKGRLIFYENYKLNLIKFALSSTKNDRKTLESMMIDIQRRQNDFEQGEHPTVVCSLMIFLFLFEYFI